MLEASSSCDTSFLLASVSAVMLPIRASISFCILREAPSRDSRRDARSFSMASDDSLRAFSTSSCRASRSTWIASMVESVVRDSSASKELILSPISANCFFNASRSAADAAVSSSLSTAKLPRMALRADSAWAAASLRPGLQLGGELSHPRLDLPVHRGAPGLQRFFQPGKLLLQGNRRSLAGPFHLGPDALHGRFRGFLQVSFEG